jgi:hypothetical protein
MYRSVHRASIKQPRHEVCQPYDSSCRAEARAVVNIKCFTYRMMVIGPYFAQQVMDAPTCRTVPYGLEAERMFT